MAQVYLNGDFLDADQARISPLDRGFLFADGVYEVIPAFNGVLFRLEEHLRRLQRSLNQIELANPHDPAGWRHLCERLIELCREHGPPLRERDIPETELYRADEIWLSSSTRDVVPVVRLNDRPLGTGRPGDAWKTLARHYIEFKRRLCGLS